MDDDENIDPSLRILAPMQSNNPASTEPMQVDVEHPKFGLQAKESLLQRLGFENDKRGYGDFRVYHSSSRLTLDFCTRTPEEAQSQFQLLF